MGTNCRLTSQIWETRERTQFPQQGIQSAFSPGLSFIHLSEITCGLGFLSECPNSRKMQTLMLNISGDLWTLLRFPTMPPVVSSHDLIPLPITSSSLSLTGLPVILKCPQACSCLRTFALDITSVWSSFPCTPVPLTHSHHSSAAFPDHSTQRCLQGPSSGPLLATPSFFSCIAVFTNSTTLFCHSPPPESPPQEGRDPGGLIHCCYCLGPLLAYHWGLIVVDI